MNKAYRQKQGWKIKRGAKATTVEYWRTEEEKTVEDETTGLKKKIQVKLEHPKAGYLNLFHASQIEGIQDQETLFSREEEPLVCAKRILEGSRANIVHREGKMAYSLKTDQLILPPPESFSSAEEYHAAALRGLVAWSGHASRLGALSVDPADPQAYVKKNLRIHLAGWYLAQKVGLPYAPSANQEEMYEHWAKLLELDAQELVTAARDAEKIVAYIMELGKEQELQSTVEQEIAPAIAPSSEKNSVRWGRYARNRYEVSTAGDARFSALNARLSDGRTIEEAYQLDIKGYRSEGDDWRLGKGKPPKKAISRKTMYQQYLALWRQWVEENPEAFHDLQIKAEGKVLTDRFASGDITQARALADLLQEATSLATREKNAPRVDAIDLFQVIAQPEKEKPLQPALSDEDSQKLAEIGKEKEKTGEIVNETNETQAERSDAAGSVDSVPTDQSGENPALHDGLIGSQSEEIPPDGTSGESRQADREAPQGERSCVLGPDREDTGRVPVAARNELSGGVPASNKHATEDPRGDERAASADAAPRIAIKQEAKKENRNNFRIADLAIGQGGPKKKFEDNVAAIKLLKQLEQEGRRATPEEQKVLALYTGWGSLAQVFRGDAYSAWAKESRELKELLTKEEYIAARGSSLNAHYTSPEVVQGMWQLAKHLGFDGGRVLEPALGVGNFFGLMPEEIAESSHLYGVELDNLTGRIARQLYPDANIEITGFEKYPAPDDFYDLAISNVPFGDYKVHDSRYDKSSFNIHNYFIAKAVDKVRPGGLAMIVTTSGTMDSGKDSELLRRQIAGKADLIGAIRLPNTAFKSNAGTEVTTDILVLQKRTRANEPSPHAQAWQESAPSGVLSKYNGVELKLNEYYLSHEDHLIGTLIESTMYGGRGGRLALDGKDVNIAERLDAVIETFPQGIYGKEKRRDRQQSNQTQSVESTKQFLAPAATRERSYFAVDGKAYQKRNGAAEAVASAAQDRVLRFIQIKEDLKHLLAAQLEPATTDEQIAALQAELTKHYDAFVAKCGYVNDEKNSRALNDDPEFGMVAAVEEYRVDGQTKTVICNKRDVFHERTIGAVKALSRAESAADALAASLSECGRVDLAYMGSLLDQEEAEILADLKGAVYRNPVTRQWETAEEYLSGNVREKLEIAKTAALQEAAYQDNVAALEKVQPKELEQEDISVGLGMPWIPEKDIEAFADHLLGRDGVAEVSYNAPLGSWTVEFVGMQERYSVAGTQTWGTDWRRADELLADALNQRTPTIYKPDPFDANKRVVDQKATEVANDKLEKIKKEFETWIWSDETRRNRLTAYYNQHFNNWRLREYDGSHLTLPGYNLLAPQLNKHQKDAVWRIMQDGNTLLGHCVGAGKTWTMQTAGMEMRRLGICRKPLYVIPSPLIEQFEKEFREIYPTAKLLTVSSENLPDVNMVVRKGTSASEIAEKRAVKNAKRQAMLSRIAMEDWDGIIISHDMFKRVPMSPELYNKFYEKQLDQIEEASMGIANDSSSKKSAKRVMKELEKAKKNVQAKLAKNVNEEKKDIVIPFEQLGIDQIFVDEADLFKNCAKRCA